jgi:serine/threonine protein kinase
MSKYNMGEIIGKGTFSIVYKATNIRTSQQVAIKVAATQDIGSMTILMREAKLYNYLKKIKGIPKMLWCGKLDGMYYIVMPLYVGTISSRPINTIDELYATGSILLSILKDLHDMSIIHRDLKPDNIMYDVAGNLVLIDLGLCKVIDSPVTHNTLSGIIGTPNYISIGVHDFIPPGKKDDTESVMYILVYLWLHNTLPWNNSSYIKNQKHNLRNTLDGSIPLKITEYLQRNDMLTTANTPSYIL